MNRTVDVLRYVIGVLGRNLDGTATVADHLPPGVELAGALPLVRVDLLPGASTPQVWGGSGIPPSLDGVTLDIDVLASSRAEAVPIAERVREVLYALPTLDGSEVTSVDCPPLSTRPDYNPHVRRLGGDVTLIARNTPGAVI